MTRRRGFPHILRYLLPADAVLAPALASAQDLREFCPTRPGLGTPPCIVDEGHVVVETAIADWTLERDSDGRTDTIIVGNTLLRYGMSASTEAQVGWAPYGLVRQRDDITGRVRKSDGTGDLTFAIKHSLSHPAGDGVSLAVQPFVTLPVGGNAIGAGTVEAGLLIPFSADLSDTLQLQLTPEIDAAADEDRHGRHLAVGSVIGLGIAISDSVDLTIEASAFRDRDPADHSTQLLAGLFAAWQPKDNLQFDVGSAIGLNADTPDLQLSVGISSRF